MMISEQTMELARALVRAEAERNAAANNRHDYQKRAHIDDLKRRLGHPDIAREFAFAAVAREALAKNPPVLPDSDDVSASPFDAMSVVARRAYDTACAKGWHDDHEPTRVTLLGELHVEMLLAQCALIASEVSEAVEAARDGVFVTELRDSDGKPEGFVSELADVIIRIFDLCGLIGADIAEEVRIKMAFNETRSHRHGGRLA